MNKKNNNSTNFNCLVKECNKTYNEYYNYSKHLTGHHGLPINMMYINFANMDKFNEWKKSEEHVNNCMFIKVSDGFYKCHRSDFILNSVNENSLINKQDEEERLYKIKTPCPAHIMFRKKDGDDGLHVIYVRTHYGYCTELRSIAISIKTQKKVQDLIRKKVQVDDIFTKIRNDFIGKNDTDYLITTRHIEDIKENMKDEII